MEPGCFEALGITKEELQERLINKLAKDILHEHKILRDEDGDEYNSVENTQFTQKLHILIKEEVDKKIDSLFKIHIAANITNFLDNLVLEETNKWGEKKGLRMTFIEYLTKKADTYLLEEVAFDGKSRKEDSYNFKGGQTRLTYLIHKHLQYAIENMVKTMLANANSILVKALDETVKLKLEEIAKTLKTSVTIK